MDLIPLKLHDIFIGTTLEITTIRANHAILCHPMVEIDDQELGIPWHNIADCVRHHWITLWKSSPSNRKVPRKSGVEVELISVNFPASGEGPNRRLSPKFL